MGPQVQNLFNVGFVTSQSGSLIGLFAVVSLTGFLGVRFVKFTTTCQTKNVSNFQIVSLTEFRQIVVLIQNIRFSPPNFGT